MLIKRQQAISRPRILELANSHNYRVPLDLEFEVKRWIRFQFPLKWRDEQVYQSRKWSVRLQSQNIFQVY